MQIQQLGRQTFGVLYVVIVTMLVGCGSHDQANSNAPGGIPSDGTPAQIQQAIKENAARQSAAAQNMPGAPAASNPAGGAPGTH